VHGDHQVLLLRSRGCVVRLSISNLQVVDPPHGALFGVLPGELL
jgi:hypothetical protein